MAPRIALGLVSLVVLFGCGAAQADDAADLAGELPLTELEPPDTEDRGEAPEARPDGAPLASGTAELSRPAPELGMGSDAVDMEASGPMIHTPRELVDFPDARFPRPEHVRGLYVNAWAAGSEARMTALLDLARRTEVNSFVIDIKDVTGYLSHRTEVPLAHEIGATGERRIRDLPALLDRLEAEGIYPIARITVAKDPLLSTHRPELAIQDTAGGVWIDSKDIVWLNPYARGVWEYHVQIAREVAQMGFPEIQWDYIRFPDAPPADMDRAVFPGSEGRARDEAIRGFLTYARDGLADLPVRSTADVFGVTTSFRRDIGLGQLWESFIDVVDVALPMVYPSHYWEDSFGYSEPNAYPYEVVRAALRDAIGRSSKVAGAGLTRPWIQDFTLGPPRYGAPEVRAQIQAAYDVGIQEWILWNPSTRYSESALEPVGGFEEEPLLRVAGVLTPASRRHIVMDSVAALPSETMSVDTLAVPVDTTAGDSVRVDTLKAEMLGVGALTGDSLELPATPVDTLSETDLVRRRR
ncbi:MAG: putative glycoside hydrolase [Gemmatimonadota bacterium]|nr:putative glycoside hydrolase [Gemmatimonadota bacterium]